jgi:hypothetical protein
MAQKTEKLNELVHKQLIDLETEMNNLVFTIGQAHLKMREIETQLKTFQEKFDKKNEQMGDILKGLQLKYPNGQVKLEDGTVVFEEN